MAGNRILSRRCGAAGTFYYSKGFRQPCLPENGIGGVTARDADRDWKIALRDRAIPDFVAPFALAHERTTSRSQQIPQSAVELRRHQVVAGSASRSAVI